MSKKTEKEQKAIFIRTVTHYYTGRLVDQTATEFVLDEAAWIADTGRFSEFLRTGEPSEVEPYPGRVTVNRGAIVDWCDWPHALPRKMK